MSVEASHLYQPDDPEGEVNVREREGFRRAGGNGERRSQCLRASESMRLLDNRIAA